MPRSTHQLYGQTYLFDVILQNWDRRIANPKLLKKGDDFRIIDHEECFISATGAMQDRAATVLPWRPGGITNYVAGDCQHRHDVWSGECMNVGVLFFCPDAGYVKFNYRSGGSRLSNAYPGINRSALLSDLKEMSIWFERHATQPSDMWIWKSALLLGQSLLGDDDSSFRWNLNGSGVTHDPEKTMGQLFDRFVMQHDPVPGRVTRSDEQVFETVKSKLKRAQLLSQMESYTVRSKFTELTFDHSIKNGRWHCVQAISLDSADEDHMQRKAERWAGRLVGLLQVKEAPQVYLVTGKPTASLLQGKYEKMTEWLRSNPADPLVIDEEQSEALVQTLSELHPS